MVPPLPAAVHAPLALSVWQPSRREISPAHVDVYTALLGGLAAQQIANDPGGDRFTRHLDALLEVFLDHFVAGESA